MACTVETYPPHQLMSPCRRGQLVIRHITTTRTTLDFGAWRMTVSQLGKAGPRLSASVGE